MTCATPKPKQRLAALAVMLLLCLVWMLVAPVFAVRAAPNAGNSRAVLASVMPAKTHHAAVCTCASCPGLHGGKCCCANAGSPGESVAFRAVCDTAPDAASPVSPLPPMVLPRRVAVLPVIFAPGSRRAYLATSPVRALPGAPRPPFAPPRFGS